MELDERIHRAVYRAAHNDLLEATLEQYYVLALRIWSMALDRAHELEEAVEAHRTLLEAIRDGDGEGAAPRRCAPMSRTSSRRCIACS